MEMFKITREKERKKDGRVLYKAAVEEWEVVEQEQKGCQNPCCCHPPRRLSKHGRRKWDSV